MWHNILPSTFTNKLALENSKPLDKYVALYQPLCVKQTKKLRALFTPLKKEYTCDWA